MHNTTRSKLLVKIILSVILGKVSISEAALSNNGFQNPIRLPSEQTNSRNLSPPSSLNNPVRTNPIPVSNGTHAQGITNSSSSNSIDPCGIYPIDSSTWVKFHFDEYIKNIPKGQNQTVQQYARSKGADNFKCGIGENCNIGQICSPVVAPDWYILYATQRLNLYLNTLHSVTEEAISFTQGTVASLYNDLLPSVVNHWALYSSLAFAGSAAVLEVAGFIFLLFAANPALLFITAPFAFMSVINLQFTQLMSAAGLFILNSISFTKFEFSTGVPKRSKQFEHWSQFNYQLSQWQEKIQAMVSNMTSTVFSTPISTDSPYSLSRILANGTFLNAMEPKNSFELETDIRNVTTAMAASNLLRSMNAFVTIDNVDCKDLDKKWKGKDVLSYCSPNGTLMNIIRAVPGHTKAINDFKNGHVLFEKYHWSTEYIATTSLNCQLKYGTGSKTQKALAGNHTFFRDPAECAFDLPVCDLRAPDLRKKRHHHERTVKFCRNVVGLPI